MNYQRRRQTEDRQPEIAHRPADEQVEKFEVLMPLLEAMLADLRELAKKKQEAPVSLAKVRRINKLLDGIRSVLANEPELAYLETLDEEALPDNGDAVMILSQYEVAMRRFEERHWDDDDGWATAVDR